MDEDKQYTLEELQKKLTEKERIFCHEYIIDWNGARAARVAGYSENSAKEIAHATLTKVHIKQYIDFIKDDIAKEAGISKLRIVKKLTRIAFSNITDVFDIKDGKLLLKDPDKSLSEYPEEVTDLIQELQETRDGIRVKLYGSDASLISLLKSMGWNEPEKFDVKDTKTIEYVNVSKQFPKE